MRRSSWLGVAAAVLAALGRARAGTLDDLDRELTALAERVSKSVVTVKSEVVVGLKGEVLPGFPGAALPVGKTTSSGVVYDAAGHVVTVASSVAPGRKVTVTLPGGATVPAKVVGRDAASNLAVLKVEAEGLTPAAWGTSSGVKPGAVILAVGSSFGMGPSVTLGVVSAVGRSVAGHADLIQITAPINPGDSGGMLANTRGELVGIVTATFGRSPSSEWLRDALERLRREWKTEIPLPLRTPGRSDLPDPERWFGRRFERPRDWMGRPLSDDEPADLPGPAARAWEGPGAARVEIMAAPLDVAFSVAGPPPVDVGSQGMNYALPADAVKVVVEQLIKHGKVSRGWLGVMMEERTDDRPGLVVANVVPDSPAAKAGLKPGDRLLSVDGAPVNSFPQLSRSIARRPPGSKVELAVRRGEEALTLSAVLTEHAEGPEEPPGEVEVAPAIPSPLVTLPPMLGIQFQPLSQDLARHLGVEAGRGVLVSEVVPGWPAEAAGIKVGDCIVAIEKEPVTGGDDLRALVRKYAGKTAVVEVVRDRKPVTLKVALPAAPKAGGRLEQLEENIRRLQEELRRLRERGGE